MTDKYLLKYTNHFSHTINPFKRDEKELEIVGDCKITNYNPKNEDGKKEGHITIVFSEEESVIKEGRGTKFSSNQSEADFSSKKFSIFTELANLDGESELSIKDIRKLDKSLIKKWGLKDLRFDYKNGVATLVWGENDILRIDFSKQINNVGINSAEHINDKKINDITIQAVHTVKSGESIAKLAQKYGVNTPEILFVNPEIPQDSIVKNDDGTLHVKLKIGQKINIPVPKTMKILQFNELNNNEQKFLDALAFSESRNGTNTESDGNYLGYYQVGEQALIDIKVYKKDGTNDPNLPNDWKLKMWPKNDFGIVSKEDFESCKAKQDSVIIAIMNSNWSVIESKINLEEYINNPECRINGVKITKAGILAAAHLCGAGDLIKYLQSNGEVDANDGNRKRVSDYMNTFSKYGDNLPNLASPLYVYE